MRRVSWYGLVTFCAVYALAVAAPGPGVAAAIAVILPSILGTYVLAAARARVWFQSPRANQLLNRGSGTLMAAAAVAVATR
jgi:threonine/homoserine/homoserine lactone efflux protein